MPTSRAVLARLTLGAVIFLTSSSALAQCQQAKLTAGDAGGSDFFGAKVSISGNRVLIAGVAHDHFGNDAGAAYIFRREGTAWIEEAELSASDATADDQFGIRVSISGDRALIGAWAHDHFGNNAGAAYIFRRDGTSWIEEAELRGNDTTGGDALGLGVCLSQDFAVVGAPGDNCAAGGDCGSAYVFRREGTSWVQEGKLVAGNAAAADKLGGNCSISGNRVVVGAIQGNPPALIPFPGKAYVFRRDGANWVQEAELTPSDGAANDLFGLSVAIDGDYILVGASLQDASCPQNADCNSGAVYVFHRIGTTWVETQKLTALDTGEADNFGKSVAIRGDLAVVGADGDDDFAFNTGAAYIFRREGNLWIEKAKLTANDPDVSDRLGFSVSLSGGLAVVGAFQDDDACPTDPGCNSGSAYVFSVNECIGAACGTLLVQVNEHRAGSGGSTIVGIHGLELCVFDKSAGSCARNIGISRRHDPDISTTCAPVVCETTDADGSASILLEAGDYVLIGEYDPDGFPPNHDGDERFIGVSASDFECDADGNADTITMRKHFQVILLPNGRTVRVNPRGGSSGRATANDWVEITNVGGPHDSLSVTAVDEDLHGGAGAYTATGTAIGIDSSLSAGQLFMTILIPFHADDIAGSEPLSVDLTYYNRSTRTWELAVGGNTQPTPDHGLDVIGDRFAVVDSTIPLLSDELGDYGVFWNPELQEGFVWANVDYTGDFANARQPQVIPTASEWGLVVLALLLLTGLTIQFDQRRRAAVA